MKRGLLLALAALAGLGAAAAGHALHGRWLDGRALAARESVRDAWAAVVAHTPGPETTYAAVESGPRAAAWMELLAAAGVPPPAPFPPTLDPGELPAGYRLVVTFGPDARADALAAPGRAVIRPGPAPARAGAALPGARDAAPPAPGSPTPVPIDQFTADLTDDAIVRRVGSGVVLSLDLDLAAYLVYLRLGDAALADQDRDGSGSLQPGDLLPPLPEARIAHPFADQAMLDLLAAVARAWPGCPLPRTRGLPAGATRLVVFTGDQDYVSDEVVELVASRLEERGARATFLLTDPEVGAAPDLNRAPDGRAPRLSRSTARLLLRGGFGLGIHPFLQPAPTPLPVALADITRILTRAQALGAGPVLAARNHHLRWRGYLEIPETEARAGVALNLDTMATCPGARPCAGFPGGAAQPIRFITPDGRLLPLLQQPTALDDFTLRVSEAAARAAVARSLAARARLLLAAAAAAEAPLVLNAHPILQASNPEWLDPLFEPGVRVISAEDWLAFVSNRRLSRLTVPHCNSPTLRLSPTVELAP